MGPGRDQHPETDPVAVDADVELHCLATLATWGVLGVGAAAGGELCAAVDRHVAHVHADVFVIVGQAVLHQLMEHAGLDPLGAAGAEGGVRHVDVADRLEDVFGDFDAEPVTNRINSPMKQTRFGIRLRHPP